MRRFVLVMVTALLAGCLGPREEGEAPTAGSSGSSSTTSARASAGTSAGNGSVSSTTSAGTSAGNGSVSSTTSAGTSAGVGSVASTTSAGNGSVTSTTGAGTSAGNGSVSGTTGSTGSCACASTADCPSGFNCVNAQCERVVSTNGGTGGGTGGVEVVCAVGGQNSSTTGGSSCTCAVDADCNDAFHQGFVCSGGVCQMGPNVGAVSSSGGACAHSAGSTSATTGGGSTGSVTCTCAVDADCNDAFHQGYVCTGGVCQMGPNGAAASSTGGACANGSGTTNSTTSAGSTPLVLAFDSAPVRFTQAAGTFALRSAGGEVATDWVSAATPWLALDRNGNGRIDDGRELFGSMTELGGGRTARNGFEALAALDANHDGRIDALDPAFDRLLLWRDLNQDRISQPGELTSLRATGVQAIELSYVTTPRCDDRGNCEREQARFVFSKGGARRTGTVVDVWLANRPVTLSRR